MWPRSELIGAVSEAKVRIGDCGCGHKECDLQ